MLKREAVKIGTFEDLSKRFPIKTIAPFGVCVVVPELEFPPNWKPILEGEGCKIHYGVDDGKACAFIQSSKPIVQTQEQLVYSPKDEKQLLAAQESTKPKIGRRPSAIPGEDLLVKLWNENTPVTEIAKQFPDKTPDQIQTFLTTLQRRGVIKPRWQKKEKRKQRGRRKGHDKGVSTVWWLPEEIDYLRMEWPKAEGSTFQAKARALAAAWPAQFPRRTYHAIEIYYRKLLRSPEKSEGAAKGWTTTEKLLLINLWELGQKVPEILPNFPRRSEESVRNEISVLQGEGKIQPRYLRPDERKPRPLVVNAAVNVNVEVDCSNTSAVDNLIRLLKEVQS
jgi:hypothetical protein